MCQWPQCLWMQWMNIYCLTHTPRKPIPPPCSTTKGISGSLGLRTPPGLADRPPVVVQLNPSASPIWVQQYPIPLESKKGIREHIGYIWKAWILVPCQIPWDTYLLPVKKVERGWYYLIQNLWDVNKRTNNIHIEVSNTYTMLSLLEPKTTVHTILDLKGALFIIPLAAAYQPLFAFEWVDPNGGYSGQLTWTQLHQRFKNSSTIFTETLHEDLRKLWKGITGDSPPVFW